MLRVGRLVALFAVPLASCAGVGQGPPPLEDVFAEVESSVVTLLTESAVMVARDDGGRNVTEEGVGSGTLISREGLILTAAHVVQTAEVVIVRFADGSLERADVVSSDPLADLALVDLRRPPPAGVHIAELADSDRVRVGSDVFVVGAPLGVSNTLSRGVLSARRLVPSLLGGAARIEVLQTDAAINPGNSGGPMFDARGRVLGVVSYIISGTGGHQGLGFAVSAATVRRALLERPPLWSGMTFVALEGASAALFHLPAGAAGLLVQGVAAGSPAARLGLRGGSVAATIAGQELLLGGDVILEVLGMPVDRPDLGDELRRRLAALAPDAPVEVVVLRAGERVALQAASGLLSRSGGR